MKRAQVMEVSATVVRPLEPPLLSAGYRLGRYELLLPVAQGGMASVWLARLVGVHGFEKIVAVKTILPDYASDSEFQRMFLDEARLAARIQHPNVAQVLDLGDEGGVLYLVMEWLEGDALSVLDRAAGAAAGAIPPGILLRILADACAGLHAAHELADRSGAPLRIVHRDVSPQNILVGKLGVAKVIDFGIAKARDRSASETQAGAFKGKVRFASPEQVLAPATIDRRADVWAIGAVLYRFLVGRAPYEMDTSEAIMTRLALKEPPPPLPDDVPAPIRNVVARALAWRVSDRYATAEELRVALEGAMSEAGVMTTSDDVAAFYALYLGDRAAVRAKALTRALASAEAGEPSAPSSPPSSRRDPRSGVVRAHGPRGEVSSTGVATSLSLVEPRTKRRRWALAAAMGAVVLAIGSVAFVLRSGGGNEVGATSAAVAPASVDVPVPAAVSAAAPAASAVVAPPASASPVASSSDRGRPQAASRPQTAKPMPPQAATAKHRGDYGF